MPGQFTVLNPSGQLPELSRQPGLSSWKVATQPESAGREMVFHGTYESYRKEAESGHEREKDKSKGLAESVWPPANAAELKLEYW